jgi:hypothetical protein
MRILDTSVSMLASGGCIIISLAAGTRRSVLGQDSGSILLRSQLFSLCTLEQCFFHWVRGTRAVVRENKALWRHVWCEGLWACEWQEAMGSWALVPFSLGWLHHLLLQLPRSQTLARRRRRRGAWTLGWYAFWEQRLAEWKKAIR